MLKLSNYTGLLPNTICDQPDGKIVTTAEINLFHVTNKLLLILFTFLVTLQVIPVLSFICWPRDMEYNSRTVLEQLDTMYGSLVTLYTFVNIFLNQRRILEVFNDWANLEIDILG